MKRFGVMKYRLPLLLRQHKGSDLDRTAFVKPKHTNIKGKASPPRSRLIQCYSYEECNMLAVLLTNTIIARCSFD